MLWEQLSQSERAICECLLRGLSDAATARVCQMPLPSVKCRLRRCYRLIECPRHRHPRILLAAALLYDRYPHLIPDPTRLRGDTETYNVGLGTGTASYQRGQRHYPIFSYRTTEPASEVLDGGRTDS